MSEELGAGKVTLDLFEEFGHSNVIGGKVLGHCDIILGLIEELCHRNIILLLCKEFGNRDIIRDLLKVRTN